MAAQGVRSQRKIVSIGKPQNIQGCRFYPCLCDDGVTLWFPSVTARLDLLSKPALIMWAAKMEREGITSLLIEKLEATPDPSRGEFLKWVKPIQAKPSDGGPPYWHKAYTKTAADIGGLTHVWIDWWLNKQVGIIKGTEPVLTPEARLAVDAVIDYAAKVELEVVSVETSVASIKHEVAGTFDCKGRITVNGVRKMMLLDWKTSSGIWPEMRMQNIAYRGIDAESANGNRSQGGQIIRLRKTADDGTPFEVEDVPYQAEVWDGFIALGTVWKAMRKLENKFQGGQR